MSIASRNLSSVLDEVLAEAKAAKHVQTAKAAAIKTAAAAPKTAAARSMRAIADDIRAYDDGLSYEDLRGML